MTFRQAAIRPPRCTLVSIENAESFECLLNPSTFQEAISVNYARHVVPGLGHQILDYISTGNRRLRGMEFFLDRTFAAGESTHTDIDDFRDFLRALTQPLESGQPPPRTLIIWPNVLTIECVLTSLEFRYTRFAQDGRVMLYTAAVEFEEVLEVRTI